MMRSLPRRLLLACFAILFAQVVRADEAPVLRYDRAATTWTEALPVGNGRLGAMVFGGIATEPLQLNEA